MPITTDQRATLQLLLERGQSYADLAALLDESDAEVRGRARSALEELAGADPDRNVSLTDYLLGQADPIDRADVVRHLRDDPADHRLAAELVERLRQVVPGASLPRLPGEARQRRFLRGMPDRARERKQAEDREGAGRAGISPRRPRLIVGLTAAAVLVVAVVLAVSGVFEDEAPTAENETPSSDTAAAGADQVPLALEPVGDSEATGRLVFGFTEEDQTYVDVRLSGLEPPANDEAYVMWFLLSEEAGFPLPTVLPVGDDGHFNDRMVVPVETLAIAQQAQSIVVALNDQRQLARRINQVLEGDQAELAFPGGTVLEATPPGGAGSDDGA